MTLRRRSWRATAATRWRRSSSTWRADATGRVRDERARRAAGARYCAASDQRDAAALLVPPAVVMAAAPGTDLLAGAADHHLGLPAKLHRAERQLLRPRRRHAGRRRDPVGHPVPRPARLLDLVSRGDVGAQPRQPIDEPAEADRVPDRADGDEPHSPRHRRDPDDAAGLLLLRLQFLCDRPAADRLLLQPDLYQLVDRHL